MQLYSSEQKRYLSAAAEKHNKLYAGSGDVQTLQYYRGIIAGMQVGKRKLYKLDAKSGLYIQSAKDLCPAQAKFAAAFPHKKIDSDIPAHVDMDKLIAAIQKSTWLRTKSNITLGSCIKIYSDIIAGKYSDFVPAKQSNKKQDFLRHNYTPAEVDAAFNRGDAYEV